MKIEIKKFTIMYLCVSIIGCSCFQVHIQTLTAKMNELFNKKSSNVDNSPPVWKVDNESDLLQSNNTINRYQLFGIDWKNISSKLVNNWWLIAVSSLLPFIVLWRMQYNIKKRLYEWKKLFNEKEKLDINSRRLTLPDLTLAKHARKETLADATQKFNNPRKLSQCNILQLKSTRRNSFERNDDLLGDTKRIRIIRRRH